jgi:hypothetical protein
VPGFEDYDPPPADIAFVATNIAAGVAIGWLARTWILALACILGWAVLRCIFAWLRDEHLAFLAGVMARGEHLRLPPFATFYVSIGLATAAGTAFGALLVAAVRAAL